MNQSSIALAPLSLVHILLNDVKCPKLAVNNETRDVLPLQVDPPKDAKI